VFSNKWDLMMERLGLNDNKKYAFVMKLLFCISNYIRF
jgi:hypothetical protein